MAALPDPNAGRVVRFVEALDEAAPPERLPVPHRMPPVARVVVALLLAIGTAGGISGIVLLWTEETPGWWFSALFTVFIGALVIVAWVAFAGSIRVAGDERAAAAAWQATLGGVRSEPGTIAGRGVRLGEEGGVNAFEVTVTPTATDGTTVTARWEPGNGIRTLLQPQVPGIGSAVLVWRADAGGPVVVDVTDPTRVGAR